MIEITLQYFDGCPNWQTTDRYMATLIAEGLDVTVDYERIDSHEKAILRGFRGSPTVLLDGVDPFPIGDAPIGLACRVYRSETGPAGSPSISQLRNAIMRALEDR
ncbi:MAG TPA: thioredoxin family protein [Acidimicrobiia bacterium]|nr:thioredoxin family protein [Acidimicrobiia bacterium]